jgi:hypothetical protein
LQRLAGHRRLSLGVAAGLVVAGLLPLAALAVAAVSLSSGGRLSITVQSAQTHGMLIEPFEEAIPPGRRGFRVRQDVSGRPAFSSTDGDCFVNAFVNDVVCAGPRSSIRVTGNAGSDRITLVEKIAPTRESQGCVENPPEPFPVEATLGGGADVFVVSQLCTVRQFAESFSFSVNVDGGPGSDTISGGAHRDTLRGGDLGDTLRGLGGDDVLQGDGGSDVLDGGEGVDTVTYAERATPVTARIGGESTGVGGEADDIDTSVEDVTGGGGNDRLFGTSGPNQLTGGGGFDELSGFAGTDELLGGSGGDTINGGDGGDTLSGAGDADRIEARDGVIDQISCGSGSDTVIADLADFFTGSATLPRRNRNGLDCESITTFAVDDGPPARPLGRLLRVLRGRASVVVACPRNARIACRGTLSARRGGIRGQILGRVGYSARLGGRTTVAVRVGNPRRGTRLVLETMERGVSAKGPRSATEVVRVR